MIVVGLQSVVEVGWLDRFTEKSNDTVHRNFRRRIPRNINANHTAKTFCSFLLSVSLFSPFFAIDLPDLCFQNYCLLTFRSSTHLEYSAERKKMNCKCRCLQQSVFSELVVEASGKLHSCHNHTKNTVNSTFRLLAFKNL